MTPPDDEIELPSDSTGELRAALAVRSAAWDFLEPALAGDVTGGWPAVDRLLRRCWAQDWLCHNMQGVKTRGYRPEDVAEAFEADQPRHALWPYFCRVYARSLREAWPGYDPETWGFGEKTRVLALDVELLYLHETLETWEPDTRRRVWPVVMRLTDAWRVLNVNSENIPAPGWPPTL